MGAPPSPEAVKAAAEAGADIARHRVRSMTDALAFSATLLVGMTAAHAAELRRRFPFAAGKVRVLGEYGPGPVRDIADPFGGIADIILKNRIMGTYEAAWRLGFTSAAMGFVLFPVMCGIFDMVAGWMALNRYTRLGSGRRDEWLWQQEEYDLDEDFID